MPTSLLPAQPSPREAWAAQAVDLICADLAELGVSLHGRRVQVRVDELEWLGGSCCSSVGGVHIVRLSSALADAEQAAAVLTHELLHAIDNCQSNHGGRWAALAQLLGIRRTGAELEAGSLAQAIVGRVVAELPSW